MVEESSSESKEELPEFHNEQIEHDDDIFGESAHVKSSSSSGKSSSQDNSSDEEIEEFAARVADESKDGSSLKTDPSLDGVNISKK